MFFSVAGFYHPYYLVMLAPAVAALSGIAVVTLWRDYRRGGWRAWLLPLAIACVAAVQVYLLQPYADWSRWLDPLIIALSAVAIAVLAALQLKWRAAIGVALGASLLALAAIVAAPTTWAAYTTQHGAGGAMPTAGPSAQRGFGGSGRSGGFGGQGALPGGERGTAALGGFGGLGGSDQPGATGSSGQPGGFGGAGQPGAAGGTGQPGSTGASGQPGGFGGSGQPGSTGGSAQPGGQGGSGQPSGNGGTSQPGGFGGQGGPGGGNQIDQQLLSYLEKNQGSTKYLVAVTSSQTADPIIISTGKPVMALGGFSGNDDILTVSQLAQLVKNGTVRYFLLDGGNQGQGFAPSAGMLKELSAGTKARVEEGLREFRGGAQGGPMGGGTSEALTSWVSTNCAVVSSTAYSPTTGSSSSARAGGTQLYDCASKPAAQHTATPPSTISGAAAPRS